MLTLTQFGNVLKKNFPLDRPVYIRTMKMPYSNKTRTDRDYGDANEYDTHFLIRINKDSELVAQKDTLMHEYAHCMAGWDDAETAHSKEWGVAYSDVYRLMVDN
jgi:Zn-dependent peptidase ImmA (M78 family)